MQKREDKLTWFTFLPLYHLFCKWQHVSNKFIFKKRVVSQQLAKNNLSLTEEGTHISPIQKVGAGRMLPGTSGKIQLY